MRILVGLTLILLATVGCDKKDGGGNNGYAYGRCGTQYGGNYNYGGAHGVGNYQMRGNQCVDVRNNSPVHITYCQGNQYGGYNSNQYGYNNHYGYNNQYGYNDPYCRYGSNYNYGNYGPHNNFGGYQLSYGFAGACNMYNNGNLVYYPSYEMITGRWYCVEYAVIQPYVMGGYPGISGSFQFRW